jgi:hypothetical protein
MNAHDWAAYRRAEMSFKNLIPQAIIGPETAE